MKIDNQQTEELDTCKAENNQTGDNIDDVTLDSKCIGKGPNVLRSPIEYEHPSEDTANLSREFVQSLQNHANETLVIDAQNGVKWTGAQLLDATSRVAWKLVQEMGLGPKRNVALISDHSDREIIMAVGCFIAGCSIYPQNPEDGFEEIKTICKIIQVDAFATQTKHHQLIVGLRNSLPQLAKVPIIWLDDQDAVRNEANDNDNNNNNGNDADYRTEMIERDNVILLDDILSHGKYDADFVKQLCHDRGNERRCPAYYMLTSGSTGYPKVVEVTRWALVNCARSMHICTQTKWNPEISDESLLPMDNSSVLAGDLPMDHGAGLCFITLTIRLGAKYIVLPTDNMEALCKGINDYKIQFIINGSTKIYQFLKKLKEDYQKGSELDMTSLSFISCVGAKVNFEPLIREVEQLYPNLRVTQSYGLTEVGYVATLPLSEATENIQSVGWLFPGVIGIIVDSEGNQLGPNENGELHLWSESLFSRYLCHDGVDADQVYKSTFDEKGYYNTGDLVHYDKEGRLFIHGRIKETLTLKGEWKILPAELEAIVNEHPLVELSVIVGIPDPEVPGVEIPRAFIKLIGPKSIKFMLLESALEDKYSKDLLSIYRSNQHELISKDIFEFAASKTAKVKHLTGGVRILQEFPKNGRLQKIDRKVLKQM